MWIHATTDDERRAHEIARRLKADEGRNAIVLPAADMPDARTSYAYVVLADPYQGYLGL